MAELSGRVCVITGGSRGIGLAIAKTFANAGGAIAILDLNDEDGAAAIRDLKALSAAARFYRVDVTDEGAVEACARQVRYDFGSVDVLVNNAGISRIGPSMDFSLDDWRLTHEVLVAGVFLCSREFGKAMRASGGGSIVNISSLNGVTAFPMRLAYSAAKAAVVSMTKVLAVEWAGYKIRVNCVAPGMIDTPMLQQVIDEGHIDVDAYLRQLPMRRFGTPEEIAESVLYLAGPRAAYVTGQVIVADGGWTTFNWIPWTGDPEAPDLRAGRK